MKNSFIILILVLFTANLLQGAMKRAPEDFLGAVIAPQGVEVEVLKFKTDQIVYAGTNGAGLYVSYDAGSKWAKLDGFPVEILCVKDILIAPNKDIFVATFGSGIYYSKDNGATWSAKNSGLKNLYVQAITITDKGKLICGTYGGGIYYSDNYGMNWARTDVGLRYDNVTCLEVMSNGYIVAGTYGGGFYVSRDTCKTWIVSNTQLSNIFINDLVKDQSGNLFAATNGAGVMMTGDGITWIRYGNNFHYKESSDIKPLIDTAISVVSANQYQIVMGTRSAGMYFWDDLWNCWQNTGDFAVAITACDVSSNGTILATRSTGAVTRSTDNGLKWATCSDKVVDVDIMELSSLDDFRTVYLNDFDNSLISISKTNTVRTVYKSVNHGNDWSYLGSFNCKTINDVEITPDGNIFVAAKEGIIASKDGGKTFSRLCHPTDKDTTYWEFTGIEYDTTSKILLSTFTYMYPDTNKPPSKPYLELVNRLYKSFNKGQTWSFTDYGEKGISSLFIDNGIWYMQQDTALVKSDNQGGSYTVLYKNKPGLLHFGQDGKQYYSDADKKIYYSNNFSPVFNTIPFQPENLVGVSSWYIEKLCADIYGNLYVGIMISSPTQGIIYELYMTSDVGKNWQILKGCYNMNFFRDIVSDNLGYTFILTNTLSKVINPKNLKSPVTTSPVNNKMGEEKNPIFAWNRALLAEEYELQIDPTDTFNSPFETNVTGDTTITSIIELNPNQEYAWRVRSKTHSARSSWVVGHFTIGMTPPMLISPAKDVTGVPLNPDLVWHKLKDATHYSVQVAEDANFNKIVFSKENHTDTTITTSKLKGLKIYYWRVKAFTKTNVSSWSEIWNFRTVLGPPQLVYPENKSIDLLLSEKLKWRKADESKSYTLQVSKEGGFANMIFDGNVGADTFKLISNLQPETDYYWHVSSINEQGTSEYSDTWTFRTSLKAVELVAPEDKKVNVKIDTKFTWLEHTSGSVFQIQISKEADFKTTIIDEKISNALEFQTNKLTYYQTYYWRMRLVVGERVGLWSEIRSFKTGIESAGLLSPPDKSIDQPTTIKFKWGDVFGSKYYQLQISKNLQFTDLVYSMDSLSKAEQYVEDLEPEILYYWRIRVWNEESFGTSQWSPVWTFTTGKVTLVLRNPKTGSTGVGIPTLLTWFAASTAEYYHLQVAANADFTNIVFDKDSIYDTKLTLSKTDVATNTNYFWHVKGNSKTYNTPWSDTWNFKTGEVSVKESELFSSVKLYPNPTGNTAELSISYQEACDATVLISTADGKIIKTDAIRLIQGETRYEIDAKHFNSGTYYISIITPSGIITRELVVVR